MRTRQRAPLAGPAGQSLFALALALATGCVSGLPKEPVEEGRDLFHRKGWRAPASPFACASCHPLAAPVSPSDGGLADASFVSDGSSADAGAADASVIPPAVADGTSRILPGLPLAGVTKRPLFWGGQQLTLRGAIEDCRLHFMGSAQPLDPKAQDTEALIAYLDSLSPADARLQPFTIVPSPKEVGPGDADRGANIYVRACTFCHGSPSEGLGKLDPLWPTLPQDVMTGHENESPATIRLIFIEKIRHGGFLGYAGRMPPFAKEVMDDGSIADILAHLQLPAE